MGALYPGVWRLERGDPRPGPATGPRYHVAVSHHRTQADLRVDGFAVTSGDGAARLALPRAVLGALQGAVGQLEYRAREVRLDGLEGRFESLYWAAEAATADGVTLRAPDGQVELTIGRLELPHGVVLARAAGGGVELVAPEAVLTDVRLQLPDLSALRATPAGGTGIAEDVPAATRMPALRQERLRFLDAVQGALGFRLKVVLDLPVLGKRTLDQAVKVDIVDGAFDYRALDDGLTWLEGKFLDLGVDDGRFKVGWSVPLFASKEIISWALAADAAMMAVFHRIPLRVLSDVRIGAGGSGGSGGGSGGGGGKKRLRSMTMADIDVRLSMVAPRALEVGGGAILFGGEDAPGIVDLRVEGALVHPPAPGVIKGRIGALDVTLKDVDLGGVIATADRVHIDGVDEIALRFDGFTPTALTVGLRKVTASNLALVFG